MNFETLSVIHIRKFYKRFKIPIGNVELDKQENLYACDMNKNYLYKLDKEGELVFSLNLASHAKSNPLCTLPTFGKDGSVYLLTVSDSCSLVVKKYSPTGALERSFELQYSTDPNLKGSSQLGPQNFDDMKILSDGTLIYVNIAFAHSGSINSAEFFLQKYDTEGKKIFESSKCTFERDRLDFHLAVDEQAGVFVAFFDFPYCIKRFDLDGHFQVDFTTASVTPPYLEPSTLGSIKESIGPFTVAISKTMFDRVHKLLFCQLGYAGYFDLWNCEGKLERIYLPDKPIKIWLDSESNLYLLCSPLPALDLIIKKVRLDYSSLDILKQRHD